MQSLLPGDRYCKSIHPFSDTPCNHLVKGGQRFLVFPELKECCLCCTSEQVRCISTHCDV